MNRDFVITKYFGILLISAAVSISSGCGDTARIADYTALVASTGSGAGVSVSSSAQVSGWNTSEAIDFTGTDISNVVTSTVGVDSNCSTLADFGYQTSGCVQQPSITSVLSSLTSGQFMVAFAQTSTVDASFLGVAAINSATSWLFSGLVPASDYRNYKPLYRPWVRAGDSPREGGLDWLCEWPLDFTPVGPLEGGDQMPAHFGKKN